MEKQRALDLILDDANLMLEQVSLSIPSQGVMVRPLRSGICDRNGRHWSAPVLAEMNLQQIRGSMETAPMASAVPVLLPESSASSRGNAEVDLTLSAVKMRECEYLLKPAAAPRRIRPVHGGSQERRDAAHGLFDPRYVELDLAGCASKVVQSVRQRKASSVAAIERLVAAATLRDEETGGHIARTGVYAGMIARGLGLPDDYAEMIALAATVHDVGKIGIQDAILYKPAPLTSQEFEVMKTHTVLGQQMLSGSACPLLQLAASIALSHHERYDGSGYPYRLAGEQIPLASRIVMLADQYDALRSRRVYKRSLDHATTCEILSRGDAVTRPDHFDPRILKTFLEMEQHLAKACAEQELELARQQRLAQNWNAVFTPLRDAGDGHPRPLTSGGYC